MTAWYNEGKSYDQEEIFMTVRPYFTPNDPEAMGQSDSTSINNAIRLAIADGCNTVVIPRQNERSGNYQWVIGESILLPDDITVILDGCYMVQETGCYCNMFRTAHAFDEGPRNAENEQKNIRLLGRNGAVLDGGVYNGYSEWTAKDGSLINNTTLLFVHLRGFTVEGFKVRHQRWWGMTYFGCCHGTIRNIEFEADFASVGPNGERLDEEPKVYADIYVKNGDGIDLRCGCSDILVENITGQTEDDTVALTALKGRNEKRFYVEEKGWDIHHIIVKNVMSNVLSGGQLRLLCADGTRVHDVFADSLVDTAPKRAWQASIFLGYAILGEYIRQRTSIRGEMYNISIRNVTSHSKWGILVGCAVNNLHISDLYCQEDVIYAVDSENITDLNAALIENVYCAKGSCKDGIFNFCKDTIGSLHINNVYAEETDTVVRNAGTLNVTLTNCHVESIRKSLLTRDFDDAHPY